MCKATAEEAGEILNYLKLSGDASGHVVNSQRSSVIFGSKVPLPTKITVQLVLSIDEEGGESIYMSMMECFSGFKRQMLFIKKQIDQLYR